MMRWLWENVAAVAGDHPTFECWPTQQADWSLHEVLLAGWGCPVRVFVVEGGRFTSFPYSISRDIAVFPIMGLGD
jgi:hypothetical protein